MHYDERTQKEYAIICNRCGKRGPWGLSKQEAKELAEQDGWQMKDGPLCPECRLREEQEIAIYNLRVDPLVREAYQYAQSFQKEHQDGRTYVRGPAEVDGLPIYILYFWYLAQHGEADYHSLDGVAVYKVKEVERTLFPDLRRVSEVAIWEENGFVRYSESCRV